MDQTNILILNWKNFSKNILKNNDLQVSLKYLNDAIAHRTYLVNDLLSDADKSIFLTLYNNEKFQSLLKANLVPLNVMRYYNYLQTLDEIKVILAYKISSGTKCTNKESKSNQKDEKSASNVQFEEGGKFIHLNNAVKGSVVLRFPPEASGYLHIGHAKAALINQHYKDHYNGKLIMRFDDTNPAKESEEFEKIILEDVKSLGLSYDQLSYSSDHFETLIKYCEDLIKSGNAYADNTDAALMKKEREEKIISKCRCQTAEENLYFWNQMKSGTDKGLQYCIRIKMDMNSNNGCMRDPTIFRCKPEFHVRTGYKYKVYPTYDFTCPIVDSLEGVTHTLRTSEYNDRNEQFYRILDLLSLRKPEIADYSRLSLQNTVLSKRKLTFIVNEGYIDGWDDPRMPTVRGILRHGMTIDGLKEFVLAQGFGRANVVMEWDKLWAFNKKVIDPLAPRYTALSGSDQSLVLVKIVDQVEIVKDSVVKHPKNGSLGKKSAWLTPTVLVERDDAIDFVENSNVTFINWGNIFITKIHKNNENTITSIDARLNLSDRDFKKTQKVTWMPLGSNNEIKTFSIPISTIYYDHIITKNVLGKDDDFKNFLNKNSKREECLIGDIELKDLKKGNIIQLQRKGYFICDEEYKENCSITGKEYPLVLINIPEGNSKERATVGMKQKNQPPNLQSKEEKSPLNANYDSEIKTDKSPTKQKNYSKSVKKDKTENKSIVNNQTKLETTNKTEMKKITRLGLEVTKNENFSEWYTQIITKAELIDYYDIKGCYILLPDSMDLWEKIQNHIDATIKAMGVKSCNFPTFISKSSLMKEKEHIADFSPEVAWVTHAGDKKLEEPIAIRPTSETAMYPYYAKRIRSHRDLPLKLNQWCNVVRWEFKHPIPFLRTREFLWQEGHTAYSNRNDAVDEVHKILDLYASVYEDLLAIPVVKGRKTEKEKFAGADFTTTTEIYIGSSGRAIQGATSHHLGQNFSKMFEIRFDAGDGKQDFVFQNSWGMTTRTIGILVMVHGDDKGLVLPPRIAEHQIVIVPCGLTINATEKETQIMMDKCQSLVDRLRKAGVRAFADLDVHRSPGFKFNYWELKGIPIRIEMGPKELSNNTNVLCYRYNGIKETIKDENMENIVIQKLEDIYKSMFIKAKNDLDSHRTIAYTMDDLCKSLNNKMLITAPFCGDKACEEKVKEISAGEGIVEEGAPSMGAKSLCIPFEQPDNLGEHCINSECSAKPKYFTMFGRSY